MNLPTEPAILISFINMKLRDKYGSLEELIDDLDLDPQNVMEELKKAGLSYDSENNRLVSK